MCEVLPQSQGFPVSPAHIYRLPVQAVDRAPTMPTGKDSKSLFPGKCLKLDTERETLDFQFDSEMPPPLAAFREGHVTTMSSGINGQLLSGIVNGNISAVRKCLKCGANPNVIAPDRRSALHMALSSGCRMAKVLLEAGADPSPLDSSKKTPLHYACISADIAMIKTLLIGGADPNKSLKPISALHCAVRSKSAMAVQILVKAGADLNSIGFFENFNPCPMSPVGLAIHQKDWRTTLPILLEAGASLNNVMGLCMEASAFEAVLLTSRDVDILKFLIRNGHFPNTKELSQVPYIYYKNWMFRRSLIGMLFRMAMFDVKQFPTVKSLIRMLVAAGYNLRKDSYLRNLRHVLRIKLDSIREPTPAHPVSASGRFPQLTWYDQSVIQQHYDWGGKFSTPPTEILEYIEDLCWETRDVKKVPSLAALSRGSIREHLAQNNKLLENSVRELPLPALHKRFLLVKDVS